MPLSTYEATGSDREVVSNREAAPINIGDDAPFHRGLTRKRQSRVRRELRAHGVEIMSVANVSVRPTRILCSEYLQEGDRDGQSSDGMAGSN
jgi:hypothetical protein